MSNNSELVSNMPKRKTCSRKDAKQDRKGIECRLNFARFSLRLCGKPPFSSPHLNLNHCQAKADLLSAAAFMINSHAAQSFLTRAFPASTECEEMIDGYICVPRRRVEGRRRFYS